MMTVGTIIFLGIFSTLFSGTGIFMIFIGFYANHLPTIIGGLLFATAGLTPLVIWLRRKLIKNYVLKHGIVIQADFLDDIYANYSINGYVPLLLRAQWVDDKNNLLYHFKSAPINENEKLVLREGKQIKVYINPNNPKHYHVDMTSI